MASAVIKRLEVMDLLRSIEGQYNYVALGNGVIHFDGGYLVAPIKADGIIPIDSTMADTLSEFGEEYLWMTVNLNGALVMWDNARSLEHIVYPKPHEIVSLDPTAGKLVTSIYSDALRTILGFCGDDYKGLIVGVGHIAAINKYSMAIQQNTNGTKVPTYTSINSKLINTILSGEDSVVDIRVLGEDVIVWGNGGAVWQKRGDIPDYERLVVGWKNREPTISMTLNAETLLKNLGSSKSNEVKLHVKNGKSKKIAWLTHSENGSSSTINIEATVQIAETSQFSVTLGRELLIKALKAFSPSNVVLKLYDAESPIYLENGKFFVFLMPMGHEKKTATSESKEAVDASNGTSSEVH